MPKKMKLKAIRANAGLSQKEVAAILKISNTTYCKWENGKAFPNQPQIEKLCAIFGVTYDFIDFIAE